MNLVGVEASAIGNEDRAQELYERAEDVFNADDAEDVSVGIEVEGDTSRITLKVAYMTEAPPEAENALMKATRKTQTILSEVFDTDAARVLSVGVSSEELIALGGGWRKIGDAP